MRSLKPILVPLLIIFFNVNAAAGHPDTLSPPLKIYLSFDDGPSPVSYRIDSVSRADSIPITVFLVGSNTQHSLTGRTILNLYRSNPLIEIANHSYYHAHKKYKQFYSEPDLVVKDILLNEDTLKLTNKLVRLPGRNTWRAGGHGKTDLQDADATADSLAGIGYTLIGWDIEWLYDPVACRYYPATQMLNAIKDITRRRRTFTSGKVVILCHDTQLNDTRFLLELGLFIRLAKAENYLFQALTAYIDPLTTMN